ncbi:restriction endonuclease [Virgibacillus soli]|uniref:restriction endonuclease n=1 Tax=Paracerasibacillus soli TaxID=480284 RepID=UPI0035E5D4A2
MKETKLLTQTKMSELVGWSEANGRRWVGRFKGYIPRVTINNKIMYNRESLRIMKFFKRMSDNGFTMEEVNSILEKDSLPANSADEEKLFIKYKKQEKNNKDYNEEVARSIPSSKDVLIPYLKMISDRGTYTASEITERLVKFYNLNEAQRLMRYEGGSDSIFLSRIRSVRYSLKKEGYIEEVNKLTYKITEHGITLLNESINEIKDEIEELEKVVDPLTVVNDKIDELENELAGTLLKQLRSIHWMKFEDIVVELLTTMGYGDGQVTKRSNDEGVDGIIKEDKLGLDNIYIQAKRYNINNPIGREAVQSFSGALDAKGARKGVFITTSRFTENARNYAERLESMSKKIILIDGKELSKLMIMYNVGVNVKKTFLVKDIDYDYFKDE